MFDKFLFFCRENILIDSLLSRILFNIILFLILLCVYKYILKKLFKKIINSKSFLLFIWSIVDLSLYLYKDMLYFKDILFKLKNDFINYFRSPIDMTGVTTLDLELFYFLKPRVIKYFKNRKLKKKRRKRREEIFKTITPHLTLYYPLETALVSVLIRFMGILLLFLIFICLSITIICSIYNVSFYSIILKLILKNICFFLIIGSSIFHIYKAYKHF